ncbi:MAG: SDR family oxidoreductase [Clostridia bacterium]|nr:SDR family oxidoreductase [Clostridia bacterium]
MKALITGASSGIGRDIAKELAKKGYDLILVARNIDKLNSVKESIKNVNVKIIQMDISNVENCKKLHEMVDTDIDILINNAGFGVFGKFDKTDLYKEIDLINTNIVALHTLAKLFLQDMKKRNKGYILNVASISGFMPGPLMATYYASKSYVVKLSESIREELIRDNSNVKIGILCPGPVATNFDNVANVKFRAKSLSSEYVARYTVEKILKNKFYIVPGLSIKCLRHVAKIVPDSIISKFSYKVQKAKNK